MKKLINVIVVLFLVLSFYGCNNEETGGGNSGVCTASINEVYYTQENPEQYGVSGLDRHTVIYQSYEYILVVEFNQPRKDITGLILQYESAGQTEERKYNITPEYEHQYTWWKQQKWTIPTDENNKELKFYLEDKYGNRSTPYSLYVNLSHY